MDQQVKTQWLQALRSGEYEQTKHRLHTYEGFCCLGVLCDFAIDGEWDSWNTDDKGRVTSYHKGGNIALLPNHFLEYVGMTHEHQEHLTRMNDDGKTFEQIARWIEINL